MNILSGFFCSNLARGGARIPLGHEAYRTALGTEGMSLVAVHRDEGDNHYYFAQETA
jgi:hypothetical protein